MGKVERGHVNVISPWACDHPRHTVSMALVRQELVYIRRASNGYLKRTSLICARSGGSLRKLGKFLVKV
jgi:hypothetical protein